MTICAGTLCSDGIVLCADTMETVGSVHRSVEKLVELPIVLDGVSAVVVCATNDAVFSDALIERVSEYIDRSDGTFASARDAIEDVTLEYCTKIWKALQDSKEKPTAEMLIGLKTVDDLRFLHLSTPTIRVIESCEFIGYGRELGIYKAGQYGLKGMPTETAAPIIAYIVDIVKNNSPYCGRSTDLAILHADGKVEHKGQDYIAKATQGYKSIEWLLDAWVFPFLPVAVSETGADILSLIGELGKPKSEWVEKIPEWLKLLAARKKSILAGETAAIPENQKQRIAFGGMPYAARILQNSSKHLYEQNLIGEETKESLNTRCAAILDLSEVVNTAIDNEIDLEMIKEMIERICLLFTASPFAEPSTPETSEDRPSPCDEEPPQTDQNTPGD
jgi:hypothetical protein